MTQRLTLKSAYAFRGVTYGPGEVDFDLRNPVQRRAARKIAMVMEGDGADAPSPEPETRGSKRTSRVPKPVATDAPKASEGDQE